MSLCVCVRYKYVAAFRSASTVDVRVAISQFKDLQSSVCGDSTNRRHQTSTLLSLLTSTKLQRAPSRAAPLENHLWSLILWFFCPHDSNLIDKRKELIQCFLQRWWCSFEAYSTYIHKYSHPLLRTQTSAHTYSPANIERWASSVIPAAQQIALCHF